MAVEKNFVVKNGIEVNDNLIYADSDTKRVGILTDVLSYTLQVNGGIGATDIIVTGVGTFPTLISTDFYTVNAGITTATINTAGINSATIDYLDVNLSVTETGIVTSLNSTNLLVIGISTLGVTSVTQFVSQNIDSDNLIVTGISTLSRVGINSAVIENLNVSDTARINTGFTTSLTSTNLRVTGITTLGVTTATNLTAQNLNVNQVSTLNNLLIDGYVNLGGTTGKDGQVLVSTGAGVTWSKLSKSTSLSIALPGQTTFYFSYETGSVEVYINGVRLASNEFTAIDGSTIVLNDPCFGDETVEILSSQTLPLSVTEVPIGVTIRTNDSIVGSAYSIRDINFVGFGVTATYAGIQSATLYIDSYSPPPGKTLYVAMNGNDVNDGLTLDYPKRTIKEAVGIASAGDTVKVCSGTYVEFNPIVVPENVSIEGAELRNCIVTPYSPSLDLIWVSNGSHLTDLSFQGQPSNSGAAVIAFKELQGTAPDRFFDAARMIRYNLDFIASEAVGYLTSTDYKSPTFTLTSGDYSSCKDDIKDIFRAVCHDITRGGNSKCVGAGKSYYVDGNLQHIVGVKTETIDTIRYAAGIARSCINNVSWNGNYQSEFTQIKDLSIQADPTTGSNFDIDSCTNVVSAIYSCVGVVTTIIDQGLGVLGVGINTTYPGNAGIGTTDPSFTPSQGVGLVTKGPYIRNCTNFIPNSIGMKVDGFHADPGDKDDMGITGMMSVDSYTQYNQGGVGVQISNGAYAQLVSIFTICNDKGIFTESGGQCDITNSNSSFGTYGLVSVGVASTSTRSSYRYTGEVYANASEGDQTIVVSGIGSLRPYSGQSVYFGELYYDIESITITNPGSGYVDPPTMTFSSPTGPSGIPAEAFAEISNSGSVSNVVLVGNGRNYRLSDVATVTFSPPVAGDTATGVVNLRPIYYQVRSATLPSSGISEITFAQTLNSDVGIGTTVFFARQSLQIVSSHSFQYIGAGNTIELARPSTGGVTVRDNEVVKLNGGEVVYTSTDQDGNFAIGDTLIIDQATGTIRGRAFERSLLNIVTPFIIALGVK